MEIVLIVICVFIILLVLLQSSKAEGASQIITGGTSDLFKNRKERGGELFISRLTYVVGAIFIIICACISLFV